MLFSYSECQSAARLTNKTTIITGANNGIGKETARDFYKRGAKIIMLCRSEEKTRNAIAEIKDECSSLEDVGSLHYKYIDLSNLSTVRKCAEELLNELDHIHILVNNAGIFSSPDRHTKEGFEVHFVTNYLSHFLLTMILLPKIIRSAPARIVNVSSIIAELPLLGGKLYLDDLNMRNRRYIMTFAYSQSKLAQIVFTKHLSRKLKAAGIANVTVYSLHPGIIASGLGRNFDQYLFGLSWLWDRLSPYLLASPANGAQTTIYCAVEEKLATESGEYYKNCKRARLPPMALREEVGEELWRKTCGMVELENDESIFKCQ